MLKTCHHPGGSQPSRDFFEDSTVSPSSAQHPNQERILLAAADLFASKGYAGTAVREIVEAAGVTKPTLYYYFRNKEDLYIKLMNLAMDTFSSVLKESLARPGTMRSRLTGLFSDIYRLFAEHVHILRLVNCIIYSPTDAAPEYDIKAKHDQLQDAFHGLLIEGVKEGELDEQHIPQVMLLLFGLFRSMQVLLLLHRIGSPLTITEIQQTIDFIIDGAKAQRKGKE